MTRPPLCATGEKRQFSYAGHRRSPIPPPLSFQGCTPREWQALARATAGLVRPTYTANGTISRAPGDHGQSHVSIAEGAIMTDVETALASCRALINQINARLSASITVITAARRYPHLVP